MKRYFESGVAALAVGLTTWGCAVEGTDADRSLVPSMDESQAVQAEQAVINGVAPAVNRSSVAIYMHARNAQGQEGWRAICSGVYLGSLGGYSLIATAMHCVAGAVSTHPWDPNYLRVTAATNPGPPWDWDNRSPPPNLITPNMVWNDWAHPELGLDQALIVLHPNDEPVFKANLSITAPQYRLGLYFTRADLLTASTFSDCGYGQRVASDPNSVGNLRCASYVQYRPDLSWATRLTYSCYSNGGCPTEGESGSGTIWDAYFQNAFGRWTYRSLLAGVTHSSMGNATPSAFVAEMVQWWQAGLCLTRFDLPTKFVNILPNSATLTAAGQRILYNTADHTLSAGGYCLQGADWPQGYAVSSVPCNPSNLAQAWVQNGNLQMVNQATGVCLTANANNILTSVPCTVMAENAWVFSSSCEGAM